MRREPPGGEDLANTPVVVGGAQIEGAGGRDHSIDPPETRRLFDALSCGVLIHDAAGAIVHANPAAARLLGVSAEQLRQRVPLGALWTATLEDGSPLPEAQQPAMVALRTGRAAPGCVVCFGRPEGERRWAQIDARPVVDADGRVVQVVSTLVDVTSRKQIERQLAALGRLERVRQLGEMASGIAHDLNNYLTLITGHGELALQWLPPAVEQLRGPRAALRTILRAATDGAETIRRLQTFGRPRESRVRERLVLGDLLRDVAKLTAPKWRDAPQAEGRHIRVHVEVEGDTAIRGVEIDLREVFTNLIFNAVDAMPSGGTILLTARRQGTSVEAEVTDTGVGIAPEVQKRIFEPFFTTKGERGTGLGLAVVYELVGRHGGRVAFDSAVGIGTIFRLSFPASRTPVLHSVAPGRSAAPHHHPVDADRHPAEPPCHPETVMGWQPATSDGRAKPLPEPSPRGRGGVPGQRSEGFAPGSGDPHPLEPGTFTLAPGAAGLPDLVPASKAAPPDVPGATEPAPDAAGAPVSGALRILTVDDEFELGEMIASMLALDGHSVVVVTSGEDALARLAARPFDVVISDLSLGAGLNGWELGAAVRAGYPHVRFVLATGWGAGIDAARARARGVDAVLSKPYRMATLRQVIRPSP